MAYASQDFPPKFGEVAQDDPEHRFYPEKRVSRGFIISLVSFFLITGAGIYVHTLIYPDRDVTILTAATSAYFAFLLIFIVYSIFAIYHAIRFGFQGDLTILTLTIYLAVSVILIAASFLVVFT